MSLFRKITWYMKGRREYTKSGYEAASKNFNPSDLEVDVSDKSYMITGANSGIGKETALQVAKRGGTVHMICRNKLRGEAAKSEIENATGNNKIQLYELDLSDLAGIVKFTNEFRSSGKPLHVLVNNAGCMVNEREMTRDGIEKNFATNTLGTYMLTVGLVPLLKAQSKARVILVTSGGMLVQKLDVSDIQFEKMNPFDGTLAYAQNKRQQVVMTEQLANQHPEVHFSCMHPGWADTPAVRLSMPEFYEKMKDRLRTAEQGADTLVWLSIAEGVPSLRSGEFFQDRVIVAKHLPLAWTKSSPLEKQRLMDILEELSSKFIVPDM